LHADQRKSDDTTVPEYDTENRLVLPRALLGRAFAAGRDILYPSHCVLCMESAPWGICPDCTADLPVNLHPCPTCAQPLPVDGACPGCQKNPPALDAVWAPFSYAWPLSQMLLRFKSGARASLQRPLAGLLAAHLPPGVTQGVDRVIPVPLHPERLSARGFNQAEQLARTLCSMRGLHLDVARARRVVATPSQQGLGRRARLVNLRHAFSVAGDLSGQRVLLVDDVMTTGATLNTLASQVRAAGASWVGAVALARA